MDIKLGQSGDLQISQANGIVNISIGAKTAGGSEFGAFANLGEKEFIEKIAALLPAGVVKDGLLALESLIVPAPAAP